MKTPSKTAIKPRIHGWKPELPDQRDKPLQLLRAGALPSKIDLRNQFPPVWDQGRIGSCVAHAVGALHVAAQYRQGNASAMMPARLFIYYNARAIDGTTGQDAGTYIRHALKSVAKQGVCKETRWPYTQNKVLCKPGILAYAQALGHQGLVYQRVPVTWESIKAALAAKQPVAFGATIYENFEQLGKDAIVPAPQGQPIGGHAMTLVGYDDSKRAFFVRNSWGANWGNQGHCWMSYSYVANTNFCDDFWTLNEVEL